MKARKTILKLFVAVILIGCIEFFGVHFYNRMNWRRLCDKSANIEIGMTGRQVVEIMGKPDFQSTKALVYKPHRVFGLFSLNSEIYIQLASKHVKTVEKRPNYRIRFNSNDWKMSSPERRRSMIDSFMKMYPPEKLSKNDVVNLLKDPSKCNKDENCAFVYPLGQSWSSFALDNEFFVVTFDNNDRVSKYCFWEGPPTSNVQLQCPQLKFSDMF